MMTSYSGADRLSSAQLSAAAQLSSAQQLSSALGGHQRVHRGQQVAAGCQLRLLDLLANLQQGPVHLATAGCQPERLVQVSQSGVQLPVREKEEGRG